jgi:hypothetical protein
MGLDLNRNYPQEPLYDERRRLFLHSIPALGVFGPVFCWFGVAIVRLMRGVLSDGGGRGVCSIDPESEKIGIFNGRNPPVAATMLVECVNLAVSDGNG